jgi:RNA polymerase sigma-70 factor (ECF subfamily)
MVPRLSELLTERCPALAAPDLQQRLEEVIDAAERAWPQLRLDRAAFVGYVADRLPKKIAASAPLSEIHWSDLYLACACVSGLPTAIAAFERVHLAQVGSFVRRVDASPDFIDELRQRLRERLLVGTAPRLAEYTGAGPLAGWLRVVAIRQALNAVRADERARRRAVLAHPLTSNSELVDRRYRSALEQAFRVALASLAAQQRQILRLHYLERLSQEELARRHNIDRSTMSRRLAAMRELVLERTHRELQRLIPGLTTSSRDSLVRALRSHIDLNLESVLKTTGG